MAQYMFILTAIIGCIYFIFRKRRFDYMSLGFFSSIVYFLPLFFGYVRGAAPGTTMPLQSSVYLIGTVLLLLLVISGELATHAVPKSNKECGPLKPAGSEEKLALLLLAGLSLVGVGGDISTAGGALLSAQKSLMMEELSRFHVVMVFSGIMGITWSYFRGHHYYAVLFGFIIIFDVFLGFRASAAISFVAIVTLALFGKGKKSLAATAWGNKKLFFIVVCGIAFLFIYKRLYSLVKLGEWDLVLERLVDIQTYKYAILDSEPFTTQSILNSILKHNFSVDGSYLLSNVYQVVPFSNILRGGSESFNAMFQPVLFPDIPGGMAGNWWAEWFAVLSWPGIVLGLFIYVIGLFSLSYLHGRFPRKISLVVLIAVVGSFFAFYIHRNEIGYFLTLEKRVLWLWLWVVGASAFLRVAVGKSHRVDVVRKV